MASLSTIRNVINAMSYVSVKAAGAPAWKLFLGAPPRTPVRPEQREVHDRAEQETLTVGGREIRTYRWGSGEKPVLLVHGVSGRAANFAGFVQGIEALGLTAVAYDAPGHGASAGSTCTILEHGAVMRAVQERYGDFHAVVGHSFGGTSAYLAARGGLVTERLVSISSVADFGSLPETFCGQLGLRPALAGELRRRSELHFAPERDIWNRFSADHRPEEVTARILVVHDENDREVGVDQGRRLAASYGDRAELLITRKLGHRRILGDPEVIGRVLDFLKD
ncbi:alpha/beta fold hydrolase [Streptomyces sp. NPDC060232]|uniref:alpha/beta fold hydrolase n=1 Tax=Streptomyces sp. NPDC060232 TaxID=3347079 RepID=UPI00365C8527